jgi:septum site-determining protein MinD
MTSIISVHSFRGGTGKSNTSANVAAQLAASGKRVAVVDTDVQSPGIHVLFGFDEHIPGRTLNDFLYAGCDITDAAHDVSDRVSSTAGGLADGGQLWLVPSSINAGDIAKVLRQGYDVELLNEGFRSLVKGLDLDVLIIDTHPGLNEETLLSITISDTLLLILRPDKQDYQGTAVTVDIARRLEVPELLLLVNKVPSSADRAAVAADVANAYSAEVAGVLPLSEDMVSNASGGLFSLTNPDHLWSQTLADVARRLGA